MFPILICPGCARRTAIPYRMFHNSAVVQPYWPEETATMNWVCDDCAQHTKFKRNEVLWEPSGAPVLISSDRAFWRVEIPCSQPGCADTISACMQTFGQTSRRSLGQALAGAHPAPTCELGHGPGANPAPISVDFIEWTGGDDYLV